MKVGGFPVLTNKYEELLECDRLILPGVGAFHYGLDQLKKLNLDTLLMNFVSSKKPVFGICLGNQLLSLAAGAAVHKLPFGNRGQNQPVQNSLTGECYITPQNHGFAVDDSTLPPGISSRYIPF